MRIRLIIGFLSLGFAAILTAAQHSASFAPAAIPAVVHAVPAVPSSTSGNHASTAPSSSHPHSGTNLASSNLVSSHPVHRKPNPPQQGTNPHSPSKPGASVCNGNYPAPGPNSSFQQLPVTNPNPGACNPTGVPFYGWSGYYFPVAYFPDSDVDDSQTGPQSNVAANDQENGSTGGMEPDSQAPREDASAESAAESDSDSQQAPVAEFVFVMRDGNTFNAVGYTFLNNTLRYITEDGFRRTVPLDSLDLEATQKSNEERGLTLNLPSISKPT